MAVKKYDDDTSLPPPPLATLCALEEQTTPELKREAQKYARGRLNLLRWAGRPVSQIYARELVDDAHADTWSGVLPWDPSECSLLEHLRRGIKKRTWLEVRHGRRISFVPLLAPANDEAVPEQIVSQEVEAALAEASHSKCDPILLHAVLAKTCQDLRSRVARDDEATFVVRCWEEGSVERDVVIALTGLTEAGYERVRKRLLYTSRQLPPELREVAQGLLRSAS